MVAELLLHAPRTVKSLAVHTGRDLAGQLPRWESWLASRGPQPWCRHPCWLKVMEDGLGHVPYAIEAVEDGHTRGLLFLAFVRSWLFGRFLVGLPYLSTGGPIADDPVITNQLIDEAASLAARLDARHLELRQEKPVDHPALTARLTTKVHMRLALPSSPDELWKQLSSKVRNQVRKGQKSGLTAVWGGEELLEEFYAVFARNMRDLGTPVFGKGLFRSILRQFESRAELCVIRAGEQPVAAGLLGHGDDTTDVPSASSVREFNSTCAANMLLFWHLLERAVQRGQRVFDFGRSTIDGNTYRFKKQWGAEPAPAVWQYHVRAGNPTDVRPDNPKYQRFIRAWQRLPVWLTRLLGPVIVRGIP